MTKVELIARLITANNGHIESGHADADRALIDYINDPEVTRLYDALPKWYA